MESRYVSLGEHCIICLPLIWNHRRRYFIAGRGYWKCQRNGKSNRFSSFGRIHWRSGIIFKDVSSSATMIPDRDCVSCKEGARYDRDQSSGYSPVSCSDEFCAVCRFSVILPCSVYGLLSFPPHFRLQVLRLARPEPVLMGQCHSIQHQVSVSPFFFGHVECIWRHYQGHTNDRRFVGDHSHRRCSVLFFLSIHNSDSKWVSLPGENVGILGIGEMSCNPTCVPPIYHDVMKSLHPDCNFPRFLSCRHGEGYESIPLFRTKRRHSHLRRLRFVVAHLVSYSIDTATQ